MLSDRRQRVLCALIEEYIAYALPVGSKTLTENYHLGVSSATIRNELSVLEAGGYITQPHTSAGRIPTDYGYRAFVDRLLENEIPKPDDSYKDILDEVREGASEIDGLLEKTSSALTRFTDCLSIVLAPEVAKLHLKQISLVSMSEHYALIIVVTEDGRVFNRQTYFDVCVTPDELADVQHTLNEAFCGRSAVDIDGMLQEEVIPALRDPLTLLILQEILVCLRESGLEHSYKLGLSTLLHKPEFADSSNLLPILQVLEDDTVLMETLDDVTSNDDNPMVRIGSENASQALKGVSVVASRYGRGPSAGIVCIVGPTRMDYSKVISAVRMTVRALDDRDR